MTFCDFGARAQRVDELHPAATGRNLLELVARRAAAGHSGGERAREQRGGDDDGRREAAYVLRHRSLFTPPRVRVCVDSVLCLRWCG